MILKYVAYMINKHSFVLASVSLIISMVCYALAHDNSSDTGLIVYYGILSTGSWLVFMAVVCYSLACSVRSSYNRFKAEYEKPKRSLEEIEVDIDALYCLDRYERSK